MEQQQRQQQQEQPLLELSTGLTELMQTASGRDLSNEDIGQCLQEFLDRQKQTYPKHGICSLSVAFLALKTTVISILALTVCMTCYSESKLSESIGFRIDAVYNWYILNHGYTMQRWVRHLTLPIQPILIQLVGNYETECYINNPFHQDLSTDVCDQCREVTGITDDMGSGTLAPILKQNGGSKRCYDDIKEFFSENLNGQDISTISTLSVVRELLELFNNETKNSLSADSKSHHQWVSKHFSSNHILRGLFPRPKFLFPTIEVGIDKMLAIDGTARPRYKMDMFSSIPIMYLQSCGCKEVKFYPVDKCSSQCVPLPSIELRPADIVIWHSAIWKPEFHPVAGSDEFSIAFLTSLDW